MLLVSHIQNNHYYNESPLVLFLYNVLPSIQPIQVNATVNAINKLIITVITNKLVYFGINKPYDNFMSPTHY